MKPLQRLGIIGLMITVGMNLAGHFIFHRHSSEFFSPAWWSAWYPVYLVWAILLFAGTIARRKSKP
jgi:hypothetical protein